MSEKYLNSRNIILIGFMGTGKSTVGRLLAERLNYCFIDIDALIVAREASSINEIFVKKGEVYFRSLETAVLKEVLQGKRLVVSTGGGAVLSETNRSLMKQSGSVINLLASPDVVAARLAKDTDRPLLRDGKSFERITTLLADREAFYAIADIRIDTTGKNVEDVVDAVLAYISQESCIENA